jgi:hypothetical protein
MKNDQDYKGVCELPLSDSGLFGFMLPDMSNKDGGALEVMRVIETWDDKPPVYVLLADVKDFADDWVQTLANAACEIAPELTGQVSHLASVRHTTVSMTNSTNRVEIITSVQRGRRWTAAEKVRIVEETFEPGMTVSRHRQKIVAIPASASILPKSGTRPELRPPPSQLDVSAAGIRLDHRKSVRPFKGIFCNDISEFESSHPSQPVRL